MTIDQYIIAADTFIRKFATISGAVAGRIVAQIAVCLVLVWIVTGVIADARTKDAFEDEELQAKTNLESISNNVAQTIQRLRGFASIIAKDEATKTTLKRLSREKPARVRGKEAGGIAANLDKYLATAAENLPADLIWVVDADGIAVASSNAETPYSLVGGNYTNRQFFRDARAGRTGQQFAIGRNTGVAGLYFSFPVFDGDKFLGATIIKWDIPHLTALISVDNVFIVDEVGVTIAARNKDLIFRAMPNATASDLPTQEKLSRYGIAEFKTLRINWRNDTHYPGVGSIDENPQPLIFTAKSILDDAVTVHVAHPFDRLQEFSGARIISFAIFSLLCALAVVAANVWLLLFHSISREAKTAERTIRLQNEIQERVRDEQELAKAILEGAVMGPNIKAAALRCHLVPATTFNGDLLLTAYTPAGDLHVLVGDFTGHGLVATIGALPVAETFRAMTEKGFRPPQILSEINKKLRTVLPTGRFLAAIFVRVERSLKKVSVINCGMPESWLIRGPSADACFKSLALPLAILGANDFESAAITMDTSYGDRVFVASDGATEALNAEKLMIGKERIGEAIARGVRKSQPIEEVISAIENFCGGIPLVDDATLVDIHLVEDLFPSREGKPAEVDLKAA